MVCKVVGGLLEMLGRLQQRFGRDATHVGTGAARGWATFFVFPLVDTRDVETQLGCTDGSNVATGTTTDDDDVKLFAHVFTSRPDPTTEGVEANAKNI